MSSGRAFVNVILFVFVFLYLVGGFLGIFRLTFVYFLDVLFPFLFTFFS